MTMNDVVAKEMADATLTKDASTDKGRTETTHGAPTATTKHCVPTATAETANIVQNTSADHGRTLPMDEVTSEAADAMLTDTLGHGTTGTTPTTTANLSKTSGGGTESKETVDIAETKQAETGDSGHTRRTCRSQTATMDTASPHCMDTALEAMTATVGLQPREQPQQTPQQLLQGLPPRTPLEQATPHQAPPQELQLQAPTRQAPQQTGPIHME